MYHTAAAERHSTMIISGLSEKLQSHTSALLVMKVCNTSPRIQQLHHYQDRMVPPVSDDVSLGKYNHDRFTNCLPKLGRVKYHNRSKIMCNAVMCPCMDYQISGPIWTYNSWLPKGRIMYLDNSSVYGHPVISID